MISVIIPTLDAERELGATLTALVPATLEGLVREVVIADGGSIDATLQIGDDAGARIVNCPRGRGPQLARGGAHAKGPWLLFLHADTRLDPGWSHEAEQFINRVTNRKKAAGAFRFALDDTGIRPRLLETLVALRCRLFRLPYGDQGLLIEKGFYEELGGFAEFPLMEDVEFVRRIGGKRIQLLSSRAVTSAARYEDKGYLRRISRNLHCLCLYFAGVAPQDIARRYDPATSEKPAGESSDARS